MLPGMSRVRAWLVLGLSALLGLTARAASRVISSPALGRQDDALESPHTHQEEVTRSPAITDLTVRVARPPTPTQHVPPPWQPWLGWFANDDAFWAVQRNYEHRRRQVAAIL
jgi:hypothetical protein